MKPSYSLPEHNLASVAQPSPISHPSIHPSIQPFIYPYSTHGYMNGYGPPSIVVLVTFAFRFRRHCPSSSSWPAPAPSTPTPRTNSFASWKFIVVQRRGLGLMTADVQRNLGWWWLLAPGGKAQRWRWMTNFDGILCQSAMHSLTEMWLRCSVRRYVDEHPFGSVRGDWHNLFGQFCLLVCIRTKGVINYIVHIWHYNYLELS